MSAGRVGGASAPVVLVACAVAGCHASLSYYDRPALPVDPDTASTPTTPTVDTSTPSDTTTTTPPTTETGTPPTPTTPTTPTVPWVNGDPLAPPPYGAPPVGQIADDCALVGIAATLDDDDVTVSSHDNNLEVRTLSSPVRGWYDVYDRSWANSGPDQYNESALVRVTNAAAPLGTPVVPNCLDQWAAIDPFNAVDPGAALLYVGTFWVEAGDNGFELEHLCPTIRAGSCANLEQTGDPDTTCAADDTNEVHFPGHDLCLVAPVP